MWRASTILICGVLLALPFATAAETVLRVGESVSVTDDQTVLEDFYAAGGTVAVSGTIAGDMYAVGGSVKTNGSIAADLGALGGTVSVHAPVADDIRIVGGDVTLAESVGGDIFVIGGSLTVLSSATIAGDVFFYGGEAEINGVVEGSVMGAAERFRIDGAVGENVDVRSSRGLVLGDRAIVSGDVRYRSSGDLTRAANAVVEGEVIATEIEREPSDSGFSSALVVFFVHTFALLCLYLFVRGRLTDFVRETLAHPSRSVVIGFGTLFAGPPVAILLMVTVLGFLLGLSGLLLIAALAIIAFILSAAVVGALLSRFIMQRTEVSFLWLLAGAAALHIALLIPFAGALVAFAATAVTLGALVFRIYRTLR